MKKLAVLYFSPSAVFILVVLWAWLTKMDGQGGWVAGIGVTFSAVTLLALFLVMLLNCLRNRTKQNLYLFLGLIGQVFLCYLLVGLMVGLSE